MIIIVCCITIFITYILMFGLITYYFIKKRALWNELFSIDTIINTLIEIFACPEHFIIYIPGIMFENTPCVENKRMKNENKEKIKVILTKINKLLKTMTDIEYDDCDDCNDDSNDDSNSTSNMSQVKWVLEGTLENFNHMYEETAEFYTKLSGSYSILNGKENKIKSIDNIDNIDNLDSLNNKNKNTKNLITLEKYVLIENNIEHCDNILSLLELIDNRDSEDDKNNTMFQIENNYMICLIYNLIESVRLYKLNFLKKLN